MGIDFQTADDHCLTVRREVEVARAPFPRSAGTVVRALAFFCLTFSVASSALAQSVTARSSAQEAFVGEPFRVQVVVSNPNTATTPTPGETPDFTIQLDQTVQNPAVNQMYRNMNGRESREVSYTYTFAVRPSRVGQLTIPAFEVNDGGRLLRSQPLRVSVKKPSSTPELRCEIKVGDRKRAYVGEKVDLTLEIWIRKYRQTGAELDVRDTYRLLDERNMSLGVFAPGSSPTYREAVDKDATGQRVEYWVYLLEASVYPSKPGPLDMGNVQIAIQYPTLLGRNVFGQLYHERDPRILRQAPQAPNIEVVAPPLEGRPPDFNGAVGTYTLSATAKPSEAAVGDPITLSLAIRGNGPLERLGAPRLGRVEDLTKDFEVSGESPAGELGSGVKVFPITVRPLRESVSHIPPVPMSFFDPTTGKYQTVYSAALPIKVRPAERLAIPNKGGEMSESRGVLAPLVESSEGLLANESNPNRVLGSQVAVVGPGAWGAFVGSPLLYALAWWVRRRSEQLKSDDSLRRRSRAYKTAKSALHTADGRLTPGQARAALVGYIADRCNAPAGGMTRLEAVRLIQERSAPADTLGAVDAFLETVERVQYGGESTPVSVDETMRLLDALERCHLR